VPTVDTVDMPGGCPMKQVAGLAEVKLEKSAQGAVVTFKAKNAADAARVQQLAQSMVDKMSGNKTSSAAEACPHCHKAEKTPSKKP
jgi:cytochrome c553